MTRNLTSIGVAVVLVILFGVSVRGQSRSTVTGQTKDQSGAVVAGAEVQLLSTTSGKTFKTKTDSSGRYELHDLPPGAYQISVTSSGFNTAVRSVALGDRLVYIEDFRLLPGNIESRVTVTAGKGAARASADTPQMITVSDASLIAQLRPSSTLRAVENAPNLTPVIANAALERPRLRGLASNRLLIVLDGERLNNVRSDPTSGVSPSLIDVSGLASVEVLSGAGSSLYGSDAMAGIINMVTAGPARSDRRHHLGLRLNGDLHGNGWFRRGGAILNWSEPRFAFRLGGSLFREANYYSGSQPVTLDEVVGLGKLATDMGNAVGNSVARSYAVWSLPARAVIPNGQGQGFNGEVDFWFFPNANHSVRYRQSNSQHKNLGFSFIAPPFDQRTQFNRFRRLDKYGLRYEGHELKSWLPRFAASAYRQKYSFTDDTITSPIVLGSSWIFVPDPDAPQNLLPVLTGDRSTFTGANLSDNKNSITTYAVDVQATLSPSAGTLITSGLSFLRDSSADEFSRSDLVPPFNAISGRASNPNSIYRNRGWFNLIEYEPGRWIRLIGGLRVDNWRTEAKVTPYFPLGVESALLDVSFARLIATPGQIDVAGAAGIIDLVRGAKGITTNRTIVTGNAGIVVRLPGGVNPYFRWGSSYREPGVTERYLLRDFGDRTFSVLVVPNTVLRPERGRSYDVGVKVQRQKWHAELGYFRNDLSDFIANAFAPALFVPADPGRGLDQISPFFPFHGVLNVQRTNTARARIRGLEAAYEVSLPASHAGTITPFGTWGLLRGSNLTPDANTLKLIGQFYNKADTPLPLHGSANDAPLSSITPLRTINGVRFDSSKRDWLIEYEARYQMRVTRADPLDLSAAISTQYGTLASLNSFAVHALRGGYTFRKEKYHASFTAGVDNLTNRFYFEHFQTAPAPGRSFVFGMGLEFFHLLGK